MPLSIGSRLGPYEIVSAIGAGGMGEVYRARDTKLGRNVALKVLPEAFSSDAQRMARFRREAQVLASLNQPNIASIYGFEDSGSRHALVMELVEGPTLADRIKTGPIPVEEALPIAKQIAEGLEYAHERGIVHRDLKPSNIKLANNDAVKILDFGLAKALEADSSAVDISSSPTISRMATQAGIILGTAAYMSPEQAKGKTVDRRTDIWSFGCVLYEMLTGKMPFSGETITDTLAAVIRAEPDWALLPKETPTHVRVLLQRCLQKDPKQRLQAIGDARIAIEEVLSGAAKEVARSAGETLPLWRRTLPWVVAAMLAVALAVVAAGWWSGTRRSTAIPGWSAEMLGGPSTAMDPRISPDGHTLAFQAMIDGLTQVGVMDTASGDWTVLTQDRSQGYVNNLSWSVDGSQIYFERFFSVPIGIFSVSRFGGDERLVLKDAKGPEVLPDGSMLVERKNEHRILQLYRFWPDSGRLNALDAFPAAKDLGSDLRAFHDGKDAVFFGTTREQDKTESLPHLYIIDLASGRSRRLGSNLDLRIYSSLPVFPLAVSADDRSVLVDEEAGNLHQIISIPRDSTRLVRTLVSLTLAPLYMDTDKSGDLYLDQVDRPLQVLRFSVSGGTPEVLAESESSWNGGEGTVVALSDGRVVFGSSVGKSRLLVARPGGEATQLIEAKEGAALPACVVGQGEIAFLLGPPNHRVVAIASVSDGRIVRRFTAIPADEVNDLAASPDGKTLYYVAAGVVWAVPAAGGEPRRIVAGDSVAPSPDGKYLIVQLVEKQGIRLVKVAVSGTAEKPISIQGDLRLAEATLNPTAVSKDGQLLVSVTAPDSWFYGAAIIDLHNDKIRRIPLDFTGDVLSPGWSGEGRIISSGSPMKSTLWRFRPTANEGN